jgi:Right handed beta helix region
MRARLFVLGASVALTASLASPPAALAQASRTWVSGVGDDANPCSRTAPCKTFAGAISKTAAGGEINVLDPGGFGAVTITKSISIVSERFTAGVLVSGTNGIIVNAGPNDVVTLRGLDFNGLGTGLSGIRFLAGGALHVEDCQIYSFTQFGIDFEPSGNSNLYVSDTEIRENNTASSNGVFIKPPAGVSVRATFDRVRLERDHVALRAFDGSTVIIRDSVASGNDISGFTAVSLITAVDMTIENSVASNNNLGSGLRVSGANGTMRITNTTVTGNSVGLDISAGASLISFGNNRIAGNGTNGAPTSTPGQQ